MTWTFISLQQTVIWVLAATLALSLYLGLVRPALVNRPEFQKFRDMAGGRIERILAWLKVRWDLAVSALLMALPSVWNGALDIIIALSRVLGDVLPALAGADLSSLILPNWLETFIRIGAALVPIIRGYLEKDGEE